LDAWRLGDESQQPIFPQLVHIRRCTQRLPIFRHSAQPSIDVGKLSTVIRSRCPQTVVIGWPPDHLASLGADVGLVLNDDSRQARRGRS
jgi:hypothetical protein